MGLFGGKKTIYSSSVVYNMAGDEENRIDYLKTVVGTSILGDTNFSMSEAINRSYLAGPGIKIRSFHRWARVPEHFDKVKVPSLKVASSYGIDLDAVGAYVPREPDQIVQVTYVKAAGSEFTSWAEQWVMANEPAKFDTEWYATQDPITEEITIYWEDLTTSSFFPVDYDADGRYVYVVYALKTASSFLGSFIWIYRAGDGIGYLDSILDQVDDGGECIPVIPIRLEKKFLSDTHYPDVYAQTKKAYTKATGKRGKKGLPKLISQIKENDDIDDIDHIYMVHGVSANAKDNASKKYLFKLLNYLRTAQPYDQAAYDAWVADKADYDVAYGDFEDSRDAMLEGEAGTATDPATGDIPVAPVMPITEIEFSNPAGFDVAGSQMKFIIKWSSIKRTTGSGLGKVGAKVGEVWWGNNIIRSSTGGVTLLGNIVKLAMDNSEVELFHQISTNAWEKLTIVGLTHENYAHRKQPVLTTLAEGISDPEDSGCIFPIHYGLLKSMSLVDSTQMMTASTLLVFNCFTVVKQKWYQSTFFMILVFIVIIAIAVIFPPSIGLLGPAMTVGATLGFTGLMAVIVGTIVNTVAAMILMKLIAAGSVLIFGDKLGAIIAAVVTIAAMAFAGPMMSGQGMSAAWGNMMSAQSIIAMTSAVGNGVAGYLKASAMEFGAKTQDLMEKYESQSKEIAALTAKLYGTSGFGFDPMNLTNSSLSSIYETPTMFLDRTLLCGSDIADMTKSMLTNFASLTLNVNTIGS